MTIQSIIEEGKKVYEIIRPSLEVKFPGQFVAIDPISKEYFIDPTIGVALTKANARFPDRQFYTTKIGERAAMTMRV
jgi:hypothetical protein